MLVLCLYMKITTCLLVLINQSRTESYEFVSSLSAHDSSQREIQKTGISYMITMGWTHLLILSCVTQLPSIWCSCFNLDLLSPLQNAIFWKKHPREKCQKVDPHYFSILMGVCFLPFFQKTTLSASNCNFLLKSHF